MLAGKLANKLSCKNQAWSRKMKEKHENACVAQVSCFAII